MKIEKINEYIKQNGTKTKSNRILGPVSQSILPVYFEKQKTRIEEKKIKIVI